MTPGTLCPFQGFFLLHLTFYVTALSYKVIDWSTRRLPLGFHRECPSLCLWDLLADSAVYQYQHQAGLRQRCTECVAFLIVKAQFLYINRGQWILSVLLDVLHVLLGSQSIFFRKLLEFGLPQRIFTWLKCPSLSSLSSCVLQTSSTWLQRRRRAGSSTSSIKPHSTQRLTPNWWGIHWPTSSQRSLKSWAEHEWD